LIHGGEERGRSQTGQTGGSEAGGEQSTAHPDQHQRFQWLHDHILNKSEKIDILMGTQDAVTDTNEWHATWHPASVWLPDHFWW
jgi:hypothetical protein